MAPSPYQIMWKNLNLSKLNHIIRKISVWAIVLIIFLIYSILWNPIYFKMKTNEIDAKGFFLDLFTTKDCKTKVNNNALNISGSCSFSYTVGDFFGGFIPGFANSFLYSMMPTLYWLVF